MINLGIIGCGWIAEKAYLPAISKMNNAAVHSVFDIDCKRSQYIQKKYHILNRFDNINSFLLSPVDAVIIAAPNNTHTYYTDLALNSGKHVLCEKPVALSKSDIESSIAIARTSGKIFFPAFVNRFRKDIRKFRELVNLIGRVKEIEASWVRKSGIPRPGTWITNKETAGGGVLTDIGTHIVDIGLSFLMDKWIQAVKLNCGTTEQTEFKEAQWNANGESRKLKFDVETWAKGEIIFANDSILKFNLNWSSDINEDVTSIKAIGDKGTVNINTLFGFSNNFIRDNIQILYKGEKNESKKVTFPMNNTFALDAFNDMIKCFINAVNGQATEILQPSDSIYIVDIIEQLYKSV